MTARSMPRISFGMIVLNGEPFIRFNLRAIYPFAHEVIVVEGASPKATHMATENGHSQDGTLAVLQRFKDEEDPHNRVKVITAEDEGYPDGFWPGEKDEQSRAYAKRATGDWLWQVDVDEFYLPNDMSRVCSYLDRHPRTTCLTFNAHYFWGGCGYVVEGGLMMHRLFQGEPWGAYRRVFQWRPEYEYASHRPPTITDRHGSDITRENLRNMTRTPVGKSIYMYHYSMLFPSQFTRKGAYYENQPWSWDKGRLAKYKELLEEVNPDNAFSIFDHHGTKNWLQRSRAKHPPEIVKMLSEISSGHLGIEMRRTDDIESLINDPTFQRRVRLYRFLEKTKAWRNHLLYLIWDRLRDRVLGP